jgi:8-oxo-dGTP pyrophosphatase MutT (NUDIX family)
MNDDVLRQLEAVKREKFKAMKPRDAATLLLVDRSGDVPTVLMGRRHDRHKFMPGKYVFPGGRVEPYDGRMAFAGELSERDQLRLTHGLRRSSAQRIRGFALAAIRETCEETGLLLGRKSENAPRVPHDAWASFAEAGVVPDLSKLQFVARAITPPGRPRRFDARFFVTDASEIAHRIDGIITPDSELDALVWIPITEAKTLDLPNITQVVVGELAKRIEANFDPSIPVPFFRMLQKKFVRVDL